MKLYKKHSNISKKRHNRVILVFVCSLFFLSVGYSILSQRLDVTGTAKITTNWDVYIESITQSSVYNAETVGTPKVTNKTNGSIEVNLNKKGARAIYRVTVKNNGNVDAIITRISGIEEANKREPIDIKVSTNLLDGTTLLAGKTMMFTITVEWDSSVTTTSTAMNKSINFTVEYQQKTAENIPTYKELASSLTFYNGSLTSGSEFIMYDNFIYTHLVSGSTNDSVIGKLASGKFIAGKTYQVVVEFNPELSSGAMATSYAGEVALSANSSESRPSRFMNGVWYVSGNTATFRFTVPNDLTTNDGRFMPGHTGLYWMWTFPDHLASVTTGSGSLLGKIKVYEL